MKPFAIMLMLAGVAVAGQPAPLEAPLPPDLTGPAPAPCQACTTPLVQRPSWICGHVDPSPYFALWEGFCQEPWHQKHYDLTPPAPTSRCHVCALHGHAASPWMTPCAYCQGGARILPHPVGKHLTHLLGKPHQCARCAASKPHRCTECSAPADALAPPPPALPGAEGVQPQPPGPQELETLPLDIQ